MGRQRGSRRAVADLAPGWLVEVVRPAPATPPWGRMTVCLIAVVTPLAVAVAAGRLIDGTLPAMGALTRPISAVRIGHGRCGSRWWRWRRN
ncbi:hypothetical protein [Nocardia miyunensis]|uniref:hypothetical protein n=1 Tax=Nocardia miyunensis TaxID=282684 RepID=UPI0008374C92|nr:hypothetical protein [Nocardia miyunensis]